MQNSNDIGYLLYRPGHTNAERKKRAQNPVMVAKRKKHEVACQLRDQLIPLNSLITLFTTSLSIFGLI
jgi:hypothetical protein